MMKIHLEETRKLRRASAAIRDGGIIHVKVPKHWPAPLKKSVVQELVERLSRKDAREKQLLAKHSARQPQITLATQAELEAFVRQVNTETLQVPLGKVQIGWAKYNHLAQVNLRTKTMTVSKYCLHQAPAEALRYLIVHELAHYFESGHGPAFWAIVGRHVPDYRLQSRIMKAFHHQAVIQEEEQQQTPTSEDKQIPVSARPLRGSASRKPNATTPPRRALKPKNIPSPTVETTQTTPPPKPAASGLLKNWFQQLTLWNDH